MNTATLTDAERRVRNNVRNYLLLATPAELRREWKISEDRGDVLRAQFIQELIEEDQ